MSTEILDDHARLLGQRVTNPSIMMNENPRSVDVLGVATELTRPSNGPLLTVRNPVEILW